MSEPPYTPLTGKLKQYFDKIKEVRDPEKVDTTWLASVGFKSGNDSYILRVLKYIGFVDDSKRPTELWKRYRDPTQSSAVLAQAIRTGYKDLFNIYADAYRKDREALYAYFSSRSNKAERTKNLMVSTFQNLCELADFEALIEEVEPIPVPKLPEEERPIPSIERRLGVREIHINIQLHLPATDDPSVYDNLFKSLKKHLLSVEE